MWLGVVRPAFFLEKVTDFGNVVLHKYLPLFTRSSILIVVQVSGSVSGDGYLYINTMQYNTKL